MTGFLAKAAVYWREFASRFRIQRDSGPIDTVPALEYFVASRAAFIAQKTLYGYVKTRMGIRFPEMFRNDEIVHSVNIAKMHVYAACLSDLAIHATAKALDGSGQDGGAHRRLAERIFDAGLTDAADEAPDEFSTAEARAAFRSRLLSTDWGDAAGTRENFTASPAALIRWAPIAEEYKSLDREYVENSIKFAWSAIRRDLARRLDAARVAASAEQDPVVAGGTVAP